MKRDYSKVINSLIDKEVKSLPKEYLLSLYVPSRDFQREQLKTRVKSLSLKGLRNNQKLKNFSRLRMDIVQVILDKINSIKDYGKGIAIFARFKYELNLRENRLEDIEIKTVKLHRRPEEEVFVGKIYDLDQLVWLDIVSLEALAINIERKAADFYIIDNRHISLYKTISNPELVEKREKKYSQKFTPTRSKKLHHGSGTDVVEKAETRENRYFLDDIFQEIRKDRAIPRNLKYVALFYSSKFNDVINQLDEAISKEKNGPKVIRINKNLRDKERIRKLAINEVKKIERKGLKNALEEAKKIFDLYKEDLKDITKASRERRIEKLFIKPNISQEGYLLDKKYIYANKVKGSRIVRNIFPWMVKDVLKSKGKIYILKGFNGKIADVAAKLRY